MIAGFEQPSEGRILLDGTDVAYTPAHKRNVNTVFQNYALFPHLDVFDNGVGYRRNGDRPTKPGLGLLSIREKVDPPLRAGRR